MSKMDVYLTWGPSGIIALFLVACTFLLPIVGLLLVVKRKVSKRSEHSAQPSATVEPKVEEPTSAPTTPLVSKPPPVAAAVVPATDAPVDADSDQVRDENFPTKEKPAMPDDIDMDFNFAKVEYNDSEFGENPQVPGCDGRLLVVTGRPVMMTDATVDGVLVQIGGALHLNHSRGTHFAALYDIRQFKLPYASEAYGRVKVLAGWCGLQVVPEEQGGGSKIDLTLHSVAIVIPAGFTSKFLKKLVGFFLWLTKPPMDPKIFEGDWDNALVFLKDRRAAYLAGELTLKPPEDVYGTAAAAAAAAAPAAPAKAAALSLNEERQPIAGVSVGKDGNETKPTAIEPTATPVSTTDKLDISSSSSSKNNNKNNANLAKAKGNAGSSPHLPPLTRRKTWSAVMMRSVSFSSSKTRKSQATTPRGKGAPPSVPPAWAVRDDFEGR